MKVIKKIKNRIYWIIKIQYRFIGLRNKIRVSVGSNLIVSKNVKIKNSIILLGPDSELIINEGSKIENVNLCVNGKVEIGKNNIINNGSLNKKLGIRVDGNLFVGNYNLIQSTIWIRFGGILAIGSYNNFNSESEFRVDENIRIGSFNQISYRVMIWDTNTHNIYSSIRRRNLTIDKFPRFGFEFEKPRTKPIIIGDDCWIGKEAAILKGTVLANKCIVGFRTLLSNCDINEGMTVITESSIKTVKNNI